MDSFDNITRVEKNAPDKIYFPADGLPSYIDWDGSPIRTKQVEDSDICYIRKNALLDYFHQRVEELNSPLNGVFGSTEREHCNERISELLLLIDKLNSM